MSAPELSEHNGLPNIAQPSTSTSAETVREYNFDTDDISHDAADLTQVPSGTSGSIVHKMPLEDISLLPKTNSGSESTVSSPVIDTTDYSQLQKRPPVSAPIAPPNQPIQSVLPTGELNTDDTSIANAQKHAKWAVSALNFEDVSTAVKELRIALESLGVT